MILLVYLYSSAEARQFNHTLPVHPPRQGFVLSVPQLRVRQPTGMVVLMAMMLIISNNHQTCPRQASFLFFVSQRNTAVGQKG